MKKKVIVRFLVPFLAILLFMGFSTIAAAKTIKIGGIMDTTGPTSDVGKDYAIGMAEAFKYINNQGGVNGKKIKFTWFDYGYRIPEAITALGQWHAEGRLKIREDVREGGLAAFVDTLNLLYTGGNNGKLVLKV